MKIIERNKECSSLNTGYGLSKKDRKIVGFKGLGVHLQNYYFGLIH